MNRMEPISPPWIKSVPAPLNNRNSQDNESNSSQHSDPVSTIPFRNDQIIETPPTNYRNSQPNNNFSSQNHIKVQSIDNSTNHQNGTSEKTGLFRSNLEIPINKNGQIPDNPNKTNGKMFEAQICRNGQITGDNIMRNGQSGNDFLGQNNKSMNPLQDYKNTEQNSLSPTRELIPLKKSIAPLPSVFCYSETSMECCTSPSENGSFQFEMPIQPNYRNPTYSPKVVSKLSPLAQTVENPVQYRNPPKPCTSPPTANNRNSRAMSPPPANRNSQAMSPPPANQNSQAMSPPPANRNSQAMSPPPANRNSLAMSPPPANRNSQAMSPPPANRNSQAMSPPPANRNSQALSPPPARHRDYNSPPSNNYRNSQVFCNSPQPNYRNSPVFCNSPTPSSRNSQLFCNSPPPVNLRNPQGHCSSPPPNNYRNSQVYCKSPPPNNYRNSQVFCNSPPPNNYRNSQVFCNSPTPGNYRNSASFCNSPTSQRNPQTFQQNMHFGRPMSPMTHGGMAEYIISIDLYRDGPDSTWGFRLKGGSDVDGGTPLEIMRVFVGTASEGVLQAGDKIVAVNNQPTDGLTHLEAQNIFKTVGTSAKVDVARMGPASAGVASPIGGGVLDDDKVHSQAYRTTPLVLPHAKTIHDSVDPNKYIKVAKETPPVQPYRSSAPLIHHGKSIHEVVDPNKFTAAANGPQDESKPYRSSASLIQHGKSIHEAIEPNMFTPVAKETQEDLKPYRTSAVLIPTGKSIHEAVETNMFTTIAKESQEDSKPYRSSAPIIHHGKSIHEVVDPNKFIPVAKETPGESKPYRTCPLVMPAPKTINEVGAGAPTYQPPRGPQYKAGGVGVQQMERPIFGAGLKSGQAPCSYNTAINLYSDDNLAAAVATQDGLHPGFVPPSKPTLPSNKDATFSKPQESETFKLILESEMGSAKNEDGIVGKDFSKSGGPDRPASQASDTSRTIDPLMKNTSINQSASFKKVMYSVLGETEF